MTDTPKTRPELFERMAKACAGQLPPGAASLELLKNLMAAGVRAAESHGVRLVPVEATERMDDEGWAEMASTDGTPRDVFGAMLAASPYAPEKAND